MLDIDENDPAVLDGNALTDLYQWIDAAPLSRPKKNIARDFSDGVLVAEIIHFYYPRAVDLHNYVQANSSGQKKINWNTLNRKVFSKLGIKLNEGTLNQVVESKPGAIEQILWDLRKKIMEKSKGAPSTGNVGGPKRGVPSQHAVNTIVAPVKGSLRASSSPARGSYVSARAVSNASGASTMSAVKTQPSTKSLGAAAESRGNIPEEKESATNIQQGLSSGSLLGEVPSQIIFRGHKMVAAELLEVKDKEIRDLENVKKQLSIKIDRLEKLVQIKDSRIEDLSHQLSNIRAMYENVTRGLGIKTIPEFNNNTNTETS